MDDIYDNLQASKLLLSFYFNSLTLNNKFKAGISQTILYYASGFTISWLAYLLVGKNSKSFPGPHHIVLILFLTGGVIWMFYYYALALAKQKYKINYGSITVHIVSMIGIFILALINLN